MASSDSQKQPEWAVRADGLVFGYGAQTVLHGVTLSVRPGEFWALAGPNGAGKSTLLHLLTGFLRPAQGRVELLGADVRCMPRREAAARVALVPQKSAAAFSYHVLEMVLMGRQPYAGLAAFDTQEDIAIAVQALERAGIAALADKKFDELSGGEQQMALIARALAQQTPIMVLDEPTSFLDLRRQWAILNLLADLARAGSTILATFHDLNLAARWASRLALMHQGRLVAQGAPEEVLREDTLQAVYGLPLRVTRSAAQRLYVDFPESAG